MEKSMQNCINHSKAKKAKRKGKLGKNENENQR